MFSHLMLRLPRSRVFLLHRTVKLSSKWVSRCHKANGRLAGHPARPSVPKSHYTINQHDAQANCQKTLNSVEDATVVTAALRSDYLLTLYTPPGVTSEKFHRSLCGRFQRAGRTPLSSCSGSRASAAGP